MKLLIFLHGTLLTHSGGVGKTREERVRQVQEGEASVSDFSTYVPVGRSVERLKQWERKGAEIFYLSSNTDEKEVEKDRGVLKRYGFPEGEVLYRKQGQTYAEIAESVMPDILIEDDCESIGGESEMTITHVRPEIRKKIKSVVVREFEGVEGVAEI